MEEALYDVPLYREFAGLDGGMVRLPDESTFSGSVICLKHMGWLRRCSRWSMKS